MKFLVPLSLVCTLAAAAPAKLDSRAADSAIGLSAAHERLENTAGGIANAFLQGVYRVVVGGLIALERGNIFTLRDPPGGHLQVITETGEVVVVKVRHLAKGVVDGILGGVSGVVDDVEDTLGGNP